jgi:formimidoylglutamate deiminase
MASAPASTGHRIGTLGAGECADYLVLDTDAPQFAGAQAQDAIDRWVFSGNRNLVRDVFVGGRQVVGNGMHVEREVIAQRYRDTMRALLAT